MKVTKVNGVELPRHTDVEDIELEVGDVLHGYSEPDPNVDKWEVMPSCSVKPNGFNIVTHASKPTLATVLQFDK